MLFDIMIIIVLMLLVIIHFTSAVHRNAENLYVYNTKLINAQKILAKRFEFVKLFLPLAKVVGSVDVVRRVRKKFVVTMLERSNPIIATCCCCCDYPFSSSGWRYGTNGNSGSRRHLIEIRLGER